MLIDTHCHLNFRAFKKDLSLIIEKAQKNGVGNIIIPGAKLDSSRKALEISGKFSACFAAIGIHPHHIKEYNALGETAVKTGLMELANSDRVIAIGEIGLDYYHYKDHPPVPECDKRSQKELLEMQLEIASARKLPVIIHCRGAQIDLVKVIGSFQKNHHLSGVFHCFDGDDSYLRQVLRLGFYVGFDGNITYPENDHLMKLVKNLPLARLLLETDSPFLAPLPLRGARNEPSNLVLITREIARIKKTRVEEIEKQTTQNALDLFWSKKMSRGDKISRV